VTVRKPDVTHTVTYWTEKHRKRRTLEGW